jgi:hypothetical protein
MADGDVKKEHLFMKLGDVGTQKTKMQFGEDSTVTLAKAFLVKYCDAKVLGASIGQELECAIVTPEGFDEGSSNVDKKLTIIAKDSVTADIIRFQIPSYFVSEDLVLVPGAKGERLNSATGQAICDAWKTANALPNPLVYLSGTPTQRA